MKVSKSGAKIELEHTKDGGFSRKKKSKSQIDMATQIARDHEKESGKKYYPALKKMETKLKKGKK